MSEQPRTVLTFDELKAVRERHEHHHLSRLDITVLLNSHEELLTRYDRLLYQVKSQPGITNPTCYRGI